MEYQFARQITEGKEGYKCTVITQNPFPIDGGGVYKGTFVSLTSESLSVKTDNGLKELALKRVDRIHFDHEQEVAHLNGEPTDEDVNDIIENGIEKEAFKTEAR